MEPGQDIAAACRSNIHPPATGGYSEHPSQAYLDYRWAAFLQVIKLRLPCRTETAKEIYLRNDDEKSGKKDTQGSDALLSTAPQEMKRTKGKQRETWPYSMATLQPERAAVGGILRELTVTSSFGLSVGRR